MLNILLDIFIDLPSGIKVNNKNTIGTNRQVRDVLSNAVVGEAKLKKVIDKAHETPANKAIYSTNVEGKKFPLSNPIIIARPAKPKIKEINLFNENFCFKKILEKIVPQIGHR